MNGDRGLTCQTEDSLDKLPNISSAPRIVRYTSQPEVDVALGRHLSGTAQLQFSGWIDRCAVVFVSDKAAEAGIFDEGGGRDLS